MKRLVVNYGPHSVQGKTLDVPLKYVRWVRINSEPEGISQSLYERTLTSGTEEVQEALDDLWDRICAQSNRIHILETENEALKYHLNEAREEVK